ncbi:MAG: CBS domain-containing protein [Myxococcota bacterium]
MELEVKRFMTGQPITIDAEASALEALDRMMDHGIRHLPVLDAARRVCGVVTFDDLRSAFPGLTNLRVVLGVEERRAARDVSVGDVMTYAPVTIRWDAPLEEAVERMIEGRFGCLPVVDARGRLDGILTEIDLLQALATVLWSKGEPPATVVQRRTPTLVDDLERERDHLTRALARFERREQETTERRREVPLDLVEHGQEAEEGRLTESLAALAARRLRAIEHALERAAQGRLEICERCGQPIASARLRALPGTTLCIRCSRALEAGA